MLAPINLSIALLDHLQIDVLAIEVDDAKDSVEPILSYLPDSHLFVEDEVLKVLSGLLCLRLARSLFRPLLWCINTSQPDLKGDLVALTGDSVAIGDTGHGEEVSCSSLNG